MGNPRNQSENSSDLLIEIELEKIGGKLCSDLVTHNTYCE